MPTINDYDNFFLVVQEYHETILDPRRSDQFRKMSYQEKKGIFYNCLRRKFNIGNVHRNYYGGMKITDFELKMDGDGRVTHMTVDTHYRNYHQGWDRWNIPGYSDEKNDAATIKQISICHPIIYPTIQLNELASIVNKLK